MVAIIASENGTIIFFLHNRKLTKQAGWWMVFKEKKMAKRS